MKKRITAAVLLLCTFVTILSGCSGKLYDYDNYEEFIKLGDYKSITVNKSDVENGIIDAFHSHVKETAEDDVQEQTYSTPNTDVLIERADTVKIDYEGKMNGETFSGGSATDYSLIIGSDTFIEGFEDGLIGYTVGDEVVLNLQFPTPYPNNENYAGKDVEFTVVIKSITREVYPDYTDENVEKYTEYATIAEFEEHEKDTVLSTLIWEQLYEVCKIKKYPEKEMKDYYNNSIQSYSQTALTLGYTLEDFLVGFYGYTDVKVFYQEMAEYAKASVKQELIILSILDKEPSLKLDKDAYEAEIRKLYDEAVENGTFDEPYSHFKKHYDDMALYLSVYSQQVVELVKKTLTEFDDVTKNGFYTNRYGTQYYIDGEMQTGWVEIEGEKYYYDEEDGYSAGRCTLMPPPEGAEAKYLQFGENGRYIGLYEGAYVDSEGTRYFAAGNMLNGWQDLDFDNDGTNERYYFSKVDGYMATGYYEVDGKYHKFDDNGAYVEEAGTGIKLDGENSLYFVDSKLVTGWVDVDVDGDGVSEKCYFDPENNGYMVVNDVVEIEGKYHKFDENGIYEGIADGIISTANGKRYFENGELMLGEVTVTEGENTNDYYFDSENGGYAYVSRWLTETNEDGEEENKFYYDGNGHKVKDKELAIQDNTYIFDSEGNWAIKE